MPRWRVVAQMHRVLFLLVVAVGLLWPGVALATTDGDEPLVVLGVAPVDGKLYLARYPDDGGDDPPELYYVVLHGTNAGRVMTVRSWYRDLEDDPDGNARDIFDDRFERLRRRLKPAKTIKPVCIASANTIETKPIPDPWIPEWDTAYKLQLGARCPGGARAASPQTLTAFGDTVDVAAEIRVPGTPLAVLLVRYFSKPFEFGYTSDVALVVPLTDKGMAQGEAAATVEYFPWGRPEDEF